MEASSIQTPPHLQCPADANWHKGTAQRRHKRFKLMRVILQFDMRLHNGTRKRETGSHATIHLYTVAQLRYRDPSHHLRPYQQLKMFKHDGDICLPIN